MHVSVHLAIVFPVLARWSALALSFSSPPLVLSEVSVTRNCWLASSAAEHGMRCLEAGA